MYRVVTFPYLVQTGVEVEGQLQGEAQGGGEAEAEEHVEGQAPTEELEGQDRPAVTPGDWHRTTEVHHLADRGLQSATQDMIL